MRPKMKLVPQLRSGASSAPPAAKQEMSGWGSTLLALLFCFLWSSAFPANKINLQYATPLWNLAIRCTLGGLIVLAALWWSGTALPISLSSYARLLLFGTFNTTLYMLFTLLGLQRTSAGTAAIIASTHPLVLALIAAIMLKEPLTIRKLAGVVLGMLAVSWVMASRLGVHDTLAGTAWVGVGVLSLIIGTLLFKWYPPGESLLVVNTVQLLASGVMLLPLAWLDAHPSQIKVVWPLVFGLGYVTLAVNIVGMAIWLRLLHHGEASKVSSYYFLTPIFGLGLSALLLNERFGLRELAGLAAVAGAIYLVNGDRAGIHTSQTVGSTDQSRK